MSIFNTVQSNKITRTPFNLSHERKFSMAMGDLVPIWMEECVPGDKWKIQTETMIRFAPLISPVMHRMNCYVHYFFVPSRIIWKDFEDFMSGELQTTTPQFTSNVVPEGSLADYMGIPTGSYSPTAIQFSELPFRAYAKVWNEFYRDQNLQNEIDVENMVVNDAFTLKQRAWEKDYFTSALPWAQKGGAVELPIEPNYKTDGSKLKGITGNSPEGELLGVPTQDPESEIVDSNATQPTKVIVENLNAMGIDINDLRSANQLQKWLERNARIGTRYIEQLWGRWNVKSKDARLQRPEYIGGGKSPVVVSEVLQTSQTTNEDPGASPQGNMSGHGINVGTQNKGSKFCEEHGYVIGIMSVIPNSAYQQGLHKMWSRSLNTDYYQPEFAQLGEQEIKNQELMVTGDADENARTFGYQSRYAEYKYARSTVHGNFRSSLDFWHLGRIFDDQPQLTEEFIKTNKDDFNRIFAVQDTTEQLWCQIYNNVTAVRPMPYHNNPTL